jgi:ribonucleoside-triphosphate reductase
MNHIEKKEIPVECYSRISGYFRPINQWNPGKRAEFTDRKVAFINSEEEHV